MSVIRLLDKHVAELIAAGEVVDRPASVIKELVENSIDANAKKITVEIKNGGITYIRVTDDGIGIGREYVETAFLRHATSKIKDSDDLDNIGTLGFRGEALASIAAVAKVRILTKTADSDFGTSYEIRGGVGEVLDDAGCPNGTTIIVQDLFYNTPARMKFLKKDVTESIAVAGIIDKIAISHPEISFSFIKDGQEEFYTDGDGDWLSCIRAVCGREFSDSLIKVDYTYENFKVNGFICKPLSARKNRSKQFFYINKRFVKSGTIMAALEEAYKNSIMVGRFPACVLNVELPKDFIDVNVHPSKTEVRFSNEKPVFYTVLYGVKSALEDKESHILSNSNVDRFKSVYSVEDNAKQTKITENIENSLEKERFLNYTAGPGNLVLNSPSFFEKVDVSDLTETKKIESDSIDNQPNLKSDFVPVNNNLIVDSFDYTIIGEIFKTYIICQVDNELVLIDKHAAHERIIYNSLSKSAEISQQMLLEPIILSLSKEDYSVIISSLDIIEKAGFLIEDFGIGKVIVRAAPTYLLSGEITDCIEEISSHLSKNKTTLITDKLDWIYHSIACRAAVKGGNITGSDDNKNLVERVFTDPSIQYCPHGRPVLIKLSRYEIEKRFGRLQ